MVKCQQHWMLNTSVIRLIASCSLPILPAIFLLTAYDLLETGLIARLCTAQLTALGFSAPVTTAMVGVAIALSVATNSWVCRLKASQSGSDQAINHHIGRVLSFATIVTLLFSCLLYVSVPYIYSALGASDTTSNALAPAALPLVVEYTELRVLGWVLLALVWQVNGILRSLGHIKPASLLLIGWMLAKSLVAYFWIGGGACDHVQGAGLIGAAYAHLIADGLFALLSVGLLARGLDLNLRDLAPHAWRFTATQLSVTGMNAGVQQLYTPLCIGVLTYCFALLGQDKVSVLGLVFRVEAMALLLPMVFTASLPGLMAANWWAGKINRVKRLLLVSFIAIAIVQLLSAWIIYANAEWLVRKLTQDLSLHQEVLSYLKIVPWSFVGAGCAMLTLSCLNAIGQSAQASLLGLSHRLGLALTLALVGTLVNGVEGAFWGIALAHWLSLILVFLLLSRLIWKESKNETSTPVKIATEQ